MSLDINKLKGIVPDNVLNEFPLIMEKFKIDNINRICHFLSQCSHESANFKLTVENLNYSADGLMKVFGKYFPPELAKQYARNPMKIANRVYANRIGNGNENSGDGYKFKGRGYIQLTGKNNYSEFDKYVPENLLIEPDLVATKYPLLSAAWFWDKNKLNIIADKGANETIVTEITKKVNGGSNGLLDRIEKFNLFYHQFNLKINV